MRGIRSTSHLTTSLPIAPGSPRFRCLPSFFEDEVPRTRDDDDVTLESLPDEIGDTDSMSGHLNEISTSVGGSTDDKTSSSPLMSLSEACSIQLLKGCVQNDILVLFSQYYQKRGIVTGVNVSYSEIAFEMKKGPPYWRFDFTCPIDGTLYHSTLPGPLFDSDPDETLVEVAKKVFGEYVILDNRQAVFLTKKGAKRSVALVVLLELGVVKLPQEGSSGVTVIPTSNGCKRQTYPKWVDQLHDLGIGGSDLKITYREEYQGDTEWNCQGMCLRCVLEIEHPESYAVEGYPRPTKHAALNSAVEKLVDYMHHVAPIMNGVDSGLEAKQRLLACDSTCASYVPPIPTSCNSPLPSGKDCDSKLYVYELEFEGESSQSFVQERSGVDESVATPMGIAFTNIVEPAHHCGVYETQEFFVPLKDGRGTERVVVRLRSRIVLHVNDVSGSKAASADRIFWMEEFNRTLYQWKSYGSDRGANKISETIEAKRANTIARSSLNRTYFFVPLTIDRDIDWALLQRVASYTRLPYMESIDDKWRIPFVGRIDLAFISFQMCVFGLALLALGLYSSVKDCHVYEEARRYHRLERWTLYQKLICGFVLLAASFLDRLIRCALPPKKLFSPEMLANHLLVQAGAKNAVYVTCGDPCEHDARLTGLSSFLTPKAEVTQNKLDYFKRKFNLDLHTASFAEYYQKKYGTLLRYPKEALLPCINLDGKETKHSDFDFLLLQQRNDGYAHLVPELVHVLPMPRHFMYLARHAKDFMPLLEREIQLARASEVLQSIGTGPLNRVSSISSTWLSALLKEATTLTPETTYQRLEFLGDAVLAFFVAIVILARNSTLKLTYRAIGHIFEGAISNRVLYDAALRIGVARLLHTNQVKWRSAFILSSGQSSKGGKNLRVEVSDKHLSDVVESLLGAAFIHDSDRTLELPDSHNGIAVSLLQKLELPIRSEHFAPGSSFSAYDAIHPCLKQGYPFDKDEAWQCQLSALGVFLDSDHHMLDELETRRKALMDILVDSSGGNDSKGRIASKTSRTLLFCALFHNDDDDDNASTREQNADKDVIEIGSEEGMRRLLNFREMLHLVGAYALQLCITNELYKRYPEASERDMHIMRACAISDDVVVYIMTKTGIQATVYGVDSKTIQRFQLKMMIADGSGSEVWKARGGWILHGGVEEYARRRRCGPSNPRYIGIGGGRLHGKKKKLPIKDTEELMFSMKAIIGALVLSTGVDSMWKYMCPLFDELLLLSADDLTQEYSNDSTIWGKG